LDSRSITICWASWVATFRIGILSVLIVFIIGSLRVTHIDGIGDRHTVDVGIKGGAVRVATRMTSIMDAVWEVGSQWISRDVRETGGGGRNSRGSGGRDPDRSRRGYSD
jgi:hypothetical protein